jgi:hypothetical protein
MRVGLIDVDSKIANLALMKISAYHKTKGDEVKFYDPLFDKHDLVYASKVFRFTQDFDYFPEGTEVIKGGLGYDIKAQLTDEIENTCPDYSLYNTDYSMGFLTRGCSRKCPWCYVPEKEGQIRPAADIEQFLRHKKAVLMDNNILACDWGIQQIEKIIKLGIRVDFNQGLDARLIDGSIAKLLSKVKWLEPLRLACDSKEMMPIVQKAIETLRYHNVVPRRYSCYVLITKDIEDALSRIRFLKGLDISPFAQPFISDTETPNETQKRLANWVNKKSEFYATTWEAYKNIPKEVKP